MKKGFISEVRYTIVEECGIIATYPRGWKKELNRISWNGKKPEWDIRDWSADREFMSTGVTLTDEEMQALVSIMKARSKKPEMTEITRTLTKEDVWGKFDEKTGKRASDGMIVARPTEKCPIFGDILPFKSVTVVCDEDQYEDVEYWLTYVHGGGCIVREKEVDGKIAIRSEYQCW